METSVRLAPRALRRKITPLRVYPVQRADTLPFMISRAMVKETPRVVKFAIPAGMYGRAQTAFIAQVGRILRCIMHRSVSRAQRTRPPGANMAKTRRPTATAAGKAIL